MKLRFLFVVLLLSILALSTLSVFAWHILGGRNLARDYVVSLINPHLGSSFEIGSLSLTPFGIDLEDINVDLSSQVELSISSIQLNTSPLRVLFSGFEASGSLERIDVIQPKLKVKNDLTSDSNSILAYRSYPLKSIPNMDAIRFLSINSGQVITSEGETVIANEIEGGIDLADHSNVNIRLSGIIAEYAETTIELNGTANLEEGSFLLAVKAGVKDIKELSIVKHQPILNVTKGNLDLSLEIRGKDDLILTGGVDVNGIHGVLAERIEIKDAALHGDIFGTSFRGDGEITLNGVQIPFGVNSSDFFVSNWDVEIREDSLNVSSYSPMNSENLDWDGNIELDVNFASTSDGMNGMVNLSSHSLSYKGVALQNVRSKVLFDSSSAGVDFLSAEILGGELDISGSYGFSGTSRFRYHYKNKIGVDEVRLPPGGSLFTSITGWLERSEGEWIGKGFGRITPDAKNKHLTVKFKIADEKAVVNVRSKDRSGWINFELSDMFNNATWNLDAAQPQELMDEIIDLKFLPSILSRLNMNLDGYGTLKDAVIIASWEDQLSKLNGVLSTKVKSENDTLNWISEITLKPDSGGALHGNIHLLENEGGFSIKDMYLSQDNDKRVLSYNVNLDSPGGLASSYMLEIDRFPLTSILPYFHPGISKDFRCDLTGNLQVNHAHVKWELIANSMFPDEAKYNLNTNGVYISDSIHVNSFSLIEEAKGEEIINFTGGYSFGISKCNNLSMRATSFPVDRVFEVLQQNSDLKYGGTLNAKLEMDGYISSPEIDCEVHLTKGIAHSREGYWLNAVVKSDETHYGIENFNIGVGITKLLQAKGKYDRNSKEYNLDIGGENIEVKPILDLFVKTDIPLNGIGSINANLKRGHSNRDEASGNVELHDAKIGPLRIDSLSSEFGIHDLTGGSPSLNLSNLNLIWPEVNCKAEADISLLNSGPLSAVVSVKGAILSLLPELDSFFSETEGSGNINLELSGTTGNPIVREANITLSNGEFRMRDVIKHFENLNIDVRMDTTGEVVIKSLSGEASGGEFVIGNRRPGLNEEAVIIGRFDLGIIQFRTVDEGIWAVIPSLMRKDWGGYFRFSGFENQGSFEFLGPAENPKGVGEVRMSNATITYPFLRGSGRPASKFVKGLLAILEKMNWNADLIPFRSCRYSRDLSGLTDVPLLDEMKNRLSNELFDVDVKVYVDILISDELDGLHFAGAVKDTLYIDGELSSERGSIEYLDITFNVQELGVSFNAASRLPFFHGHAVTQVVDSLGSPKEIRLVIHNQSDEDIIDDGILAVGGESGDWEDISLVLENDQGQSPEQILALLGYSPEGLTNKLGQIGGKLASNVTPFRKWTKVIERQAERYLGVDFFSIDSPVTQNILERTLTPSENENGGLGIRRGYLNTLDRSKITVGKYLSHDVYLLYTGLFVSQTDLYNTTRIGFIHDWDLMYRLRSIAPNLSLNYRFRYDNVAESSSGSVIENFYQNSSLFIRYSVLFDMRF